MAIIEFEQTPNPDALRVQSGQRFTSGAALDFDRMNCERHPVAAELLGIDGVERVMVARDFVTIVRSGPAVGWDALRPQIALALAELGDSTQYDVSRQAEVPLGEVERHIEEVLERYVPICWPRTAAKPSWCASTPLKGLPG